jgi:hypothetical protein
MEIKMNFTMNKLVAGATATTAMALTALSLTATPANAIGADGPAGAGAAAEAPAAESNESSASAADNADNADAAGKATEAAVNEANTTSADGSHGTPTSGQDSDVTNGAGGIAVDTGKTDVDGNVVGGCLGGCDPEPAGEGGDDNYTCSATFNLNQAYNQYEGDRWNLRWDNTGSYSGQSVTISGHGHNENQCRKDIAISSWNYFCRNYNADLASLGGTKVRGVCATPSQTRSQAPVGLVYRDDVFGNGKNPRAYTSSAAPVKQRVVTPNTLKRATEATVSNATLALHENAFKGVSSLGFGKAVTGKPR